jgi:PAS domain S-box-containing protein
VRLVPAFAARSSACQAGPPRWKMVIRTKIPADHPFRSRMTDNRSMDPRVARAHETTARVTTIAEVERPTRYATRVMEQIEAEKALRESEARFRELADNISQFAWTADQTGWIYWYNKRWHDYTGTTLKEMEGWGWQKVHHPDHVGRVVQRIRQSFETGTPWEDTFPLRGRDGSYRWFLSRALPIRNEAAMSAAIAHEIKQPLAAIVTNANAGLRWLNRATPNLDEARVTLEDIAANAHRANEVVQSVRGIIAKTDQALTSLDISELIRETIALVRGDLEAAGIVVQLELAAQLPLISAHKGRLQQVILNVVTNAADAMRAVTDRGRVLTVKCGPEADNIAVLVQDSGTGIDPKNIEQIFDPFFTTKSNGMGIGLAICRTIIQAHGGKLSASPAVPHGSVFRIILPAIVDT